MILKNLVGSKFGRWSVLKRSFGHGQRTYWICQCSCGNVKDVCSYTLTKGLTKSCGCLHAELASIRGQILYTTHGETQKNITPEYKAWQSMKTRCYNKNTHYYKLYGGRGIAVCERWLNSYETFLADIGRRPSNQHSLDRVNNNGPYSPDNCRWATRSQQRKNQRKRAECR